MSISNLGQQRTLLTRRLPVAMVLLLLLVQSVTAFLVTPMTVDHDAREGKMTIVLCTLQGTRSITVDMPELAGDDPQVCPALELNHITGTASLTAPPPVLSLHNPPIGYTPTTLGAAHRTLHYAAFSSRAPPITHA